MVAKVEKSHAAVAEEASFDNRVARCIKEMQDELTCLDLNTIFGLLCGERLPNGKVKLTSEEGRLQLHGKNDFERFYSHVCSLPHVKDLGDEEERFLDSAFGNTIFH